MNERYTARFRKVFASSDFNWGFCICAGCCTVSANSQPPDLFRLPSRLIYLEEFFNPLLIRTPRSFLLLSNIVYCKSCCSTRVETGLTCSREKAIHILPFSNTLALKPAKPVLRRKIPNMRGFEIRSPSQCSLIYSPTSLWGNKKEFRICF